MNKLAEKEKYSEVKTQWLHIHSSTVKYSKSTIPTTIELLDVSVSIWNSAVTLRHCDRLASPNTLFFLLWNLPYKRPIKVSLEFRHRGGDWEAVFYILYFIFCILYSILWPGGWLWKDTSNPSNLVWLFRWNIWVWNFVCFLDKLDHFKRVTQADFSTE